MKLLAILITLSLSCGDDLDYHYEGHRHSSAVNPEIPTAVDIDTKDADISPFSYPEETSIITVSSSSADGYHKKGDTLEFTLKFSTIVSVESGIPSLEFALKAHEFIAAQALYTGGSGTDSLNFEYTVGENDNAVDIDFSKINSNSALLTTPDGSPVNTLIQSKNFSDTRNISMDNVASVAITLDGIYENDVSANKNPTLHVAGKDIVGFHYKLATNKNSCLSSQGYTNVDALSINLDLSNEASGVKVLCALGKTSTGFVKPYDNGPSSFTWQYDAVLPYVLNLYARSGDDNYNTGSRIIFDIVFSDRVIVAGGTPTLSFQTNASSSLNGEEIY